MKVPLFENGEGEVEGHGGGFYWCKSVTAITVLVSRAKCYCTLRDLLLVVTPHVDGHGFSNSSYTSTIFFFFVQVYL